METFFISLLLIFCLADRQALGDSCIKVRNCTDKADKVELVECPLNALDASTKVNISVELKVSEQLLDLDCPSISGECKEHNQVLDKCQIRNERCQLPDLKLLKELYYNSTTNVNSFDNITHVEIRNFQLTLPGDFTTIFPRLNTLELFYTDPHYERYGLFPVLNFEKKTHFSVFQ